MRDELYLVDTSVWLEVLPPGKGGAELRQAVDALLAADRVVTTGMVRLELLGGARTSGEYGRLRLLLSALPSLPVAQDHWDQAANLGFELRGQGLVVPFTDLLIAAVAMQANAILVHRDHHFDLLADHIPLKAQSYTRVRG